MCPPSSTLILRRSGSAKSSRSGIGLPVRNLPLGSCPKGPCCHESPIVAPGSFRCVAMVPTDLDKRRPKGGCEPVAEERSRSTTAELIRVERHEVPDARRRPACHSLHTVCHPVIPTRPVQLGHRHQVPGQVLRQPHPFQLPFPILGGDV